MDPSVKSRTEKEDTDDSSEESDENTETENEKSSDSDANSAETFLVCSCVGITSENKHKFSKSLERISRGIVVEFKQNGKYMLQIQFADSYELAQTVDLVRLLKFNKKPVLCTKTKTAVIESTKKVKRGRGRPRKKF